MQFRVLTTATDPTLPRRAVVDGIEVTRVLVRIGSRVSNLLASLRMAAELFRVLPHVDLVHVQGFSSKNILVTAMAKLFGRPVIMHLQTAMHDEPATVRAQGAASWWAFRSANQYLSVSPGLTARYHEAGLPAVRIRDVPNGVDTARFTPASAAERRSLRRRLRLPEDRPIVLFVGVMMADKQPHILLDAWLTMRRRTATASSIVFVGASDPKLYELADRLAERVRADADASGFGADVLFVPPTPDIEDYFRAADIFVLPSVREGLPIVLLEAMACGLAVVASRLPGSTDTMIESGLSGVLVPPGDVAGFATALEQLLSDPEQATRVGAAARGAVEARYAIEGVARQWNEAYLSLLASRSAQ